MIVAGRGSTARGYGKSFNLTERGAAGERAILLGGFIASAICRATLPVDGEIISLLKRRGEATERRL